MEFETVIGRKENKRTVPFLSRRVDEAKRIHQMFPQWWNRCACSTLQN